MAARTLPMERPAELRRADSISSDAFDLQTALESQLRLILESYRTRSVEGSTDEQVDTENWVGWIIDVVKKFPIEIVPVSREGQILSPVLGKPGEEEVTRRDIRGTKELQAIDVGALKKRCKKLQEALRDEKAARADVQKAKYDVDSECERLMDEEKERREELRKAEIQAQDSKAELRVLRERLEAEKTRADEMEKERDEVRGTIADKRRKVEVEKLEHEAVVKELNMYRSCWNNPVIEALLQGKSELAGHWNQGAEEEERMFEEIRKSHRHAPPHISKTSKTPSQNHACDSNPITENLHRRIADQRTEITLLEKRLTKAKAERVTNADQAVLDLSFRLDETLEMLQNVYKELSAADMARDDALAEVRRLERRIREFKGSGGSSQGSAFSARTPGLEDTEEEGDNIEEAGNSDEAEVGGESWADELEKYQENEDYGSEITIGITLDGEKRHYLAQKYNAQVLENARLLEEGVKLQSRIQRLEEQAEETRCGPDFLKNKLTGVNTKLRAIIEKLGEKGIAPDPFGFGDGASADMVTYNNLVDERDRCTLAIEGRHPARERLRNVHCELMAVIEEQLRDLKEKHYEATKRLKEAESRANRVFGAKMLVTQNEGTGETRAPIHNLEGLVSSQLDFDREVKPLLGSTGNITTEPHAIEAEVLQQLEVPQEVRAKVEALLGKISEDAGDDADLQEAREAIRQALQGMQEGGGMKLEGKWYELRGGTGKLRRFVDDARKRLYEDAFRLGMKKPELRTTSAEAFATSLNARLSPVLTPLGHPHLFTTVLSFVTPHIDAYQRLIAFILTAILHLTGSRPVEFPPLRACDAFRVLRHAAVLAMLQTYLALSRERDLWINGNSGFTTAYVHDLQDRASCRRWSWGVDPRFMAFESEFWDIVRRVFPGAPVATGGG